MAANGSYWSGLSAYAGGGWNRFWFTPSGSLGLSVQRLLVGSWALVWQLSFTADLLTWFGPRGWLDGGLYRSWVLDDSNPLSAGRLSYLFASSPTVLLVLHGCGAVILLSFALGWQTRITSILSLIVVLAYIHRAPFLGGAAEPVLSMMVGYLCLSPCGTFLSLDARRRPLGSTPSANSAWSTLARRLLQVHLVIVYIVLAATKLAGIIWWNGEAVWWLAVQPSSAAWGLDALKAEPVLINVWSYGILLSEAVFAVLVWNPWFRPLVLSVSAVSWLSVAIVTGNWPLAVTMWIANLVFVEDEQWQTLLFRNRTAVTSVGLN